MVDANLIIEELANASEREFSASLRYEPRDAPFDTLALSFDYAEPSGSGWIHALFNPARSQGLETVDVDYSLEFDVEANVLNASANFNATIIPSQAPSELLDKIEAAVALSKTPNGMELLKQMVREYTGESVKLESLTLEFNRTSSALSGSASLSLDVPKLIEFVKGQIIPALPEELKELPNITRLKVMASIDRELAELSLEWRVNGHISEVLDGLVRQISETLPSQYSVKAFLEKFAVGVRKSFEAKLSYRYTGVWSAQTGAELSLNFMGLNIMYRERPDETFNAVIEEIRGLMRKCPACITSLAIFSGSDQNNEVVIWHDGVAYKSIEVSGDISMLDFTLEVRKNLWGIADYAVVSRVISIKGISQNITVASNSTVKNIVALEENAIAFYVEGRDGTVGALNATIPKAALGGADVNSLKVLIDNVETSNALISEASDVIVIYVSYTHSVHTIKVQWTYPQAFPSHMLAYGAAIAAIVIVAATLIAKRAGRSKSAA
jgi:hypothetical protein